MADSLDDFRKDAERRASENRGYSSDELNRMSDAERNIAFEVMMRPPSRTPSAKPTIKSSDSGFATPGLLSFLKQHAHHFEALRFMEDHEPDGMRRIQTDDRCDFKCPNEDGHSSPRADDTAFVVENASAREGGFWMHCMHASCLDASGGDRAWFLDQACQNYGIKHAAELLEWCPGVEETGGTVAAGTDDEGFQRPDNGGARYKNAFNVRRALHKLGVRVRFDIFANVERIRGLEDFPHDSEVDDAALSRLWITIDEKYKFRPAWDLFCKAVEDDAYRNRYNPVDEYLTDLRWDGKSRIDRWLIDYAGAADTPLNRAFGRLWLIAAVRRARKPGTKFDQMLVFEDHEGTGKSTAFAILAGKDEWFTDQVPLTAGYKDVQELLAGIWIAEMGELAGLRKADVEPVKSFLARRFDRGRGAYKRKTKSQGRTCVFGGSTNDAKYLKSMTGNRRFWPVRTGKIDLAALKRDRDQLWAEAAKLEADGASITLDERLWSEAAKVQNARRMENPYVDVLGEFLGEHNGGIRSTDVWKLLNVPVDRQHPNVIDQVADALRQLGWGQKKDIKWGGKTTTGYRKGDAQDLKVSKQFDGTPFVEKADSGADVGTRSLVELARGKT